jgi:hypothetical protein
MPKIVQHLRRGFLRKALPVAGLAAFVPRLAAMQGGPKILKVLAEPHVFIDANGDPDAGYMVKGIIYNTGRKVRVVVQATFSCSEGEYYQKRTVLLDHDETEIVHFGFPQPTLGATNPRAIVEIVG